MIVNFISCVGFFVLGFVMGAFTMLIVKTIFDNKDR